MREDPLDGETAAPVVERDGAERPDLEAAVSAANGTVERELQLGSLLVSVPEPNVGALCETDGLARVETAGTLGLAIDDGE